MARAGEHGRGFTIVADELDESLSAITTAVDEASEMVQQIAIAARKQTTVAEEMDANVISINIHAEESVEVSKNAEVSSIKLATQFKESQRK